MLVPGGARNWAMSDRISRNICRSVEPGVSGGGSLVSERLWEVSDIVALLEAAEPKPGKRGPYKKRAS
jgi:hypothetical protein